ncbi:uncharacterized protein I303_102931 [Kwoniella dejecticola CBS 10117]|uniref:DUF7918 domain-containing protein n=1 Tax=Kwoniella dejecticola CBS 10117 TaxID=1296121 RepID=A0AAJ8KMI4_9TREE
MLAPNSEAGFEAWVGRKDSPERLSEYQITHHLSTHEQPAYSECYLETIDEPFEIRISKRHVARGNHVQKKFGKNAHMGYRAECRVDGISLSYSCWKERYKDKCWNQVIERDEDGKSYSSSLKFAPLQTTDDPDQVTIDANKLQNLGLIEITLTRGYWVEQARNDARGQGKPKKWKNDVADEKMKKTTDRREIENQGHRHSYNFVPSTPVPEYKFVFKYRPRAALMIAGIIDEPPPPSPEPARKRQTKRKRGSLFIDPSVEREDDDDNEDDVDVDVDVKPKVKIEGKRVKYLEDQVRMLSSELHNVRNGAKGTSKGHPVDLTLDD